MIVNGQAPMSFELTDVAKAQLALRYDLSVQAAKGYFDAGYTVVYQDLILGPTLAEVVAKFKGYPLEVVVLAPDAETISRRETRRNKSGYRNRAEIDQWRIHARLDDHRERVHRGISPLRTDQQ